MISVIGPGAVGGLLAAMLERAGTPVTVVARRERAVVIAGQGISVHSPALGNWNSRFQTVATAPSALPTLLAVKGHALAAVLPAMAAARPVEVLAVLNGVSHAATLREALPDCRVIAASITVEAATDGASMVHHHSPFVRLGVADDDTDATTVAALRGAGVEVARGGAERHVLWRKYRFLAPMALLTALHDLPLGPALGHDAAVTAAVLDETARLATAEGLLTSAAELRDILGSLPAGMRSSLQRDMSAGRPTELEPLGGALLALARRHELETPALSAVVHHLRARSDRRLTEDGRTPSGPGSA